jgi:hypothetical protein
VLSIQEDLVDGPANLGGRIGFSNSGDLGEAFTVL